MYATFCTCIAYSCVFVVSVSHDVAVSFSPHVWQCERARFTTKIFYMYTHSYKNVINILRWSSIIVIVIGVFFFSLSLKKHGICDTLSKMCICASERVFRCGNDHERHFSYSLLMPDLHFIWFLFTAFSYDTLLIFTSHIANISKLPFLHRVFFPSSSSSLCFGFWFVFPWHIEGNFYFFFMVLWLLLLLLLLFPFSRGCCQFQLSYAIAICEVSFTLFPIQSYVLCVYLFLLYLCVCAFLIRSVFAPSVSLFFSLFSISSLSSYSSLCLHMIFRAMWKSSRIFLLFFSCHT